MEQSIQAAARLPALRESTRTELCGRLMRAKDHMDANFRAKLPLAAMAQIAFLSPHHFLRSFKLAFGVTPHQYLISLRLDAARHALTDGNRTISEICNDVGFESLGSFSWLFKKHFGLSPDQYRKKIVESTPISNFREKK
jgi:AraC family transcriptional regulator